MSLNSFTTIKAAVGTWLDRSDMAGVIPDLIAIAEARLYRELRIKALEESLSSVISSGVVSVPSDYIQMKNAYIDGKYALQRADASYIYDRYPDRTAQGVPIYFAREADNFIFGPYPDSAYTMKGVYYKKLPALSASNETNWFTDNCPELVLFGALVEAEPYIGNDARIILWESKFASIRDTIQRNNDREEFSGSRLQTVAG